MGEFDFKKIIIFFLVGIGVLLLIAGIVYVTRSYFAKNAKVELVYWGLWEPDQVLSQVIADYTKSHPNVTVKYVKQSPIQYRERLQSAMGKTTGGPDIARVHNSWMPMMVQYLEPVPNKIMTASQFRSTFYPVASADLIVNGSPYALPLEIDTLGLYVNTDLLTAAGVEIPTEWEQFREAARKLTVRDNQGRIRTAGAAVGNATNVDHWQDIVSLMMLQAGVDVNRNPATLSAQEALLYYTTFISVDKVWDGNLDGSTLAFAQGKVAMYFGPSWRFFDIKNINSKLNFRVVPVPQLAGAQKVNYASYWAEAVSKNSANKEAAFEFLKYLTSEETMIKLYTEAAKIRAFGEPYSRVSMATKVAADPDAGPFIAAAATAKSSYLASFTSDGETGLNSRISQYFADAVNKARGGGGAKTALETVAEGMAQVLASYGVK